MAPAERLPPAARRGQGGQARAAQRQEAARAQRPGPLITLLLATALASVELTDVLDRVDARVPQLAAAQSEIEAAQAKLLGARGAFDPQLVGKGSAYGGKDPRSVLTTGVELDSILGVGGSVGYRRGTGDFPAYAGDDITGDAGEWVGRIEVPLLQGLGFGAERARLEGAARSVDVKEASRDAKRVELRAKASAAYWKWVADGREAGGLPGVCWRWPSSVSDALERQVERGAATRRSTCYDNERVVLSERTGRGRRSQGAAPDSSPVILGPVLPRLRRGPRSCSTEADLPTELAIGDASPGPSSSPKTPLRRNERRRTVTPRLGPSRSWRPLESGGRETACCPRSMRPSSRPSQ